LHDWIVTHERIMNSSSSSGERLISAPGTLYVGTCLLAITKLLRDPRATSGAEHVAEVVSVLSDNAAAMA